MIDEESAATVFGGPSVLAMMLAVAVVVLVLEMRER